MIAFLHGKLVEKHPTRVVVDVNGVGYEVFIPLCSYDRLPPKDHPCLLLTHHHVREDAQVLFGFTTEAERAMFVLLMTITGIGPKLALSALSGLSVRELKAAIAGGDIKRLSSISGIGKKTAERMVVELRDKIGQAEALEAVAGAGETSPENATLRDAVLALIALGYKQDEGRRMAVEAMRADGSAVGLTVEEVVKRALSR